MRFREENISKLKFGKNIIMGNFIVKTCSIKLIGKLPNTEGT